jgi:hypothetical protein
VFLIILAIVAAGIVVAAWALLLLGAKSFFEVRESRADSSEDYLERHISELYYAPDVRGITVGARMFRGMLLSWLEPCLDTTAFGWQARLALHPESHPSDSARQVMLEFVERHWDSVRRGFSHHPEALPTLYAVHAAVVLLRVASGLSVRRPRFVLVSNHTFHGGAWCLDLEAIFRLACGL